ncbi:LOW QUALITY PROTEIN: hypothetical protein NC651_018164 [Populus alba x Populus x berolinensis]|nr:LOW QUALITY PROTEIN: hypothetical protein NC651_018164 [Populus alba x Populus x berolinensis]
MKHFLPFNYIKIESLGREPLHNMVLPLHNRWHPDIPPVAEWESFPGVEMVDFSGGGITKEYAAEDIKNADPSTANNFTTKYHILKLSASPLVY